MLICDAVRQVHLCHGLSYPISGLNKKHAQYQHPGYGSGWPIVPHGISVAVTGPAVFAFTAPSSPDRHREAAAIFNTCKPDDIDERRVSDADIGDLLADRIARFLDVLEVPRGLKALGCVSNYPRLIDLRFAYLILWCRYDRSHVADLVEGTLPQRRVLDLAPGMKGSDGRRELEEIITRSYQF